MVGRVEAELSFAMQRHPLLLPIVVPDELRGVVVSDPEILGGTPVFSRSRVPIKNLFDYIQGGDTIAQFLDDFEGVTEEQVQAVLEAAGRGLFQPRKSA